MALPTFGSAVSAQNGGNATVTLTGLAVSAGQTILVGIGSSAPSAANTTSVVRNGTENFDEVGDFASGDIHVSLHRLMAPAAGTFNIVCTLGASQDELGAAAITLNGVDATWDFTGDMTTDTGTGTTASTTCPATANDLIVDVCYFFNTTLAAGADQDMRKEEENISGFASLGMSTQAGTFDDVMSWTASSSKWAIMAVPVPGESGARYILGTH